MYGCRCTAEIDRNQFTTTRSRDLAELEIIVGAILLIVGTYFLTTRNIMLGGILLGVAVILIVSCFRWITLHPKRFDAAHMIFETDHDPHLHDASGLCPTDNGWQCRNAPGVYSDLLLELDRRVLPTTATLWRVTSHNNVGENVAPRWRIVVHDPLRHIVCTDHWGDTRIWKPGHELSLFGFLQQIALAESVENIIRAGAAQEQTLRTDLEGAHGMVTGLQHMLDVSAAHIDALRMYLDELKAAKRTRTPEMGFIRRLADRALWCTRNIDQRVKTDPNEILGDLKLEAGLARRADAV